MDDAPSWVFDTNVVVSGLLSPSVFLSMLQFQDWVTALPWTGTPPPDEDDTVFLEVAAQTTALILVTGNERHYLKNCRGRVSVISPQEAWRRFTDIKGFSQP